MTNNSTDNNTTNAYLGEQFSLEGRTALIPGGGGFLGQAMARGLGGAGARIALIDRALANLEDAANKLRAEGIDVCAVEADCTDRVALESALVEIEAAQGPVDVLVNAVGGNMPGATVSPGESIFDIDPEALRRVVDINLMAGAIMPSLAVGRRLEELKLPGSIINIASVSAILPLTRVVGYGAAKAAVKNFTEWLAVDLAKRGEPLIRVNALVPGFFLTDQNRFLLTNEDGSLTERGQVIISQTPMGRFGKPEELIGAAIYLASKASGFVTGVSHQVDGGFCVFSGV